MRQDSEDIGGCEVKANFGGFVSAKTAKVDLSFEFASLQAISVGV